MMVKLHLLLISLAIVSADGSNPTATLFKEIASALNSTQDASTVFQVLRHVQHKSTETFTEPLGYGHDGLLNKVFNCETCELAVLLLKRAPESASEFVAGRLCVAFADLTERVCHGFLKELAPTILYVLRHTKLSTKQICAALVKPECVSKSEYLSSELFWNLTLPEPLPRRVKSWSDDGVPLRVLQLTDIHYDPYYENNTANSCGEPLCCRQSSPFKKTSQLSGYWGSFGTCDIPLRTTEALIDNASERFPSSELDLVLFTGDIVPHDVWNATRSDVFHEINATTRIFKELFKTLMFLPVLGNHESLPLDQFPTSNAPSEFSLAWLYEHLYTQWSLWIPNDQADTFRSFGYYTKLVRPGLRAIMLNTNLGAKVNFWNLYEPRDPGNQLTWLIHQLQQAEAKQEKVLIHTHVPIDDEQQYPTWAYNYYRILNRYSKVITASFNGHTHGDEVRVYYSNPLNTSEATGVAFVGGSLTTYDDFNPMYRLYKINTDGLVLNHETFMVNMSQSNEQDVGLKSVSEYDANTAYDMPDQSASSWAAVYEQMAAGGIHGDIFRKYYHYYTRFSVSSAWNGRNCGVSCRQPILKKIAVRQDSHLFN